MLKFLKMLILARDKEMFDKNDGKRLFSPRIQSDGRRNLDKPIEEHLIAYKKFYRDNKKSKQKEKREKFQQDAKLNLCAKSSQILADSFVSNLSRMYETLGGDASQ